MGKIEPKIDPELLAQAQQAGVPVDQVIEDALRAALRRLDDGAADARAAAWAVENADAIQAQKERIEQYEVFGEDLRTW